MRSRTARLAILVVAVLALAGCSRPAEHVLTLRDWTFVGPGHVTDVHLPARVDALLPRAPCEYHLLAHVDLPPELREQPLTLAFPFLHARAELRANGALLVGLDPEMRHGYRGTDQPRWRVPADVSKAGALDLDLTVSYRNLISAWLDVPPRLSDTEDGDRAFVFVATFDRVQAVLGLAVVLLTTVLYGLIFLLDRRRRSHGWLTVQGLVGAGGYAIIYTGLSQTMYGVYEHSFVASCLCIGAAASIEFTHEQLGLGKPSRLWWVAALGVRRPRHRRAEPLRRAALPAALLVRHAGGRHRLPGQDRVARVAQAAHAVDARHRPHLGLPRCPRGAGHRGLGGPRRARGMACAGDASGSRSSR